MNCAAITIGQDVPPPGHLIVPARPYEYKSNSTTWRLAAMNMAIRGIDFNFGKEPANSFTNDQPPICAPTSSWPTRPST